MWLINTSTYKLGEFHDERQVEYANLSHQWEYEEVLFREMISLNALTQIRSKKGFHKIQKCCQQASSEGLKYAWVDTCSIDKRSSAELQEAIKSMFRWCKAAKVCYVYLSDVSVDSSFQYDWHRS
jgi:acetoin utilization deacetylase AcuC-like enzyme